MNILERVQRRYQTQRNEDINEGKIVLNTDQELLQREYEEQKSQIDVEIRNQIESLCKNYPNFKDYALYKIYKKVDFNQFIASEQINVLISGQEADNWGEQNDDWIEITSRNKMLIQKKKDEVDQRKKQKRHSPESRNMKENRFERRTKSAPRYKDINRQESSEEESGYNHRESPYQQVDKSNNNNRKNDFERESRNKIQENKRNKENRVYKEQEVRGKNSQSPNRRQQQRYVAKDQKQVYIQKEHKTEFKETHGRSQVIYVPKKIEQPPTLPNKETQQQQSQKPSNTAKHEPSNVAKQDNVRYQVKYQLLEPVKPVQPQQQAQPSLQHQENISIPQIQPESQSVVKSQAKDNQAARIEQTITKADEQPPQTKPQISIQNSTLQKQSAPLEGLQSPKEVVTLPQISQAPQELQLPTTSPQRLPIQPSQIPVQQPQPVQKVSQTIQQQQFPPQQASQYPQQPQFFQPGQQQQQQFFQPQQFVPQQFLPNQQYGNPMNQNYYYPPQFQGHPQQQQKDFLAQQQQFVSQPNNNNVNLQSQANQAFNPINQNQANWFQPYQQYQPMYPNAFAPVQPAQNMFPFGMNYESLMAYCQGQQMTAGNGVVPPPPISYTKPEQPTTQ